MGPDGGRTPLGYVQISAAGSGGKGSASSGAPPEITISSAGSPGWPTLLSAVGSPDCLTSSVLEASPFAPLWEGGLRPERVDTGSASLSATSSHHQIAKAALCAGAYAPTSSILWASIRFSSFCVIETDSSCIGES